MPIFQPTPAVPIQVQGSPEGVAIAVDFVGAGVTVDVVDGVATIDIPGGASAGVSSLSKSGSAQLTGDVTLSQGTNVTLTQVGQDISIAASGGGGGGGNVGTATLNFGAFPGASDASVAVTGQSGIASGSVVQAWVRPEDTADHTADEHMVETLKVYAGSIVAGTGFTVYGFNDNQLNEPLLDLHGRTNVVAAGQAAAAGGIGLQQPMRGGLGTRIYGQWSVAWTWS